jgi:hypothetical protein
VRRAAETPGAWLRRGRAQDRLCPLRPERGSTGLHAKPDLSLDTAGRTAKLRAPGSCLPVREGKIKPKLWPLRHYYLLLGLCVRQVGECGRGRGMRRARRHLCRPGLLPSSPPPLSTVISGRSLLILFLSVVDADSRTLASTGGFEKFPPCPCPHVQ